MRAGVECQFVLWTICSSVDKNTNARQIYTEEIATQVHDRLSQLLTL